MRNPTTPSSKPVLLAGGNPQVAKADGDGPVQAYLSAIPGWKRDVGRRLDELICKAVPGVHKFTRPYAGIRRCTASGVKVGS